MDDAAVAAGAAHALGAGGSADEAPLGATLSADEAADLVVRTVQAHAQSLLSLARRHSLCADDAHDAYQRGMEIFLRRAQTLEPTWAAAWLHQVVKHEAMAVREARMRVLGSADVDLEGQDARDVPSPEDRLISFEHVARSAEALQRLKPHEARALWLKASGRSYAQIARETGWSYTKVNRCITEGRRSFMARYASIEAGEECGLWAPVVTAMIDGEATREEIAEARPHLRNCPACRAVARDAHRQAAALRVLFPVAAVGMFQAPAQADTGGLLARIYEAVVGGLHERTTASALKVQATLEAASAGKVAAVAASAAALAGGGIAVVDKAVQHDHRLRPPATRHHETQAAKRAAPASTAAARGSGSGATPRRNATAREFGGAAQGSSAAAEFGTPSPAARSASAGTATSPPSPPAPVRRPPAAADFEFGP